MKLAILIGVSDYNSQQNLPASKNDVKLIKSMLDFSDGYDDLLYIDTETNTRQIKGRLSEFIERHSSDDIDDLFFYFSGHGLFDGSDFHYILSDFDAEKIKSTSLENSELDTMIKSLKPCLTIKIVDACNSGVSYIKDPAAFSKYITDSKLHFSKCYFMFSSEDTQFSFADPHLSFFTKAIGEAVAYTPENSIRYKDIIDYISDKFSKNEKQSPVFINQASFTEVFIKNITPENRKNIEETLSIVSDSKVETKRQPLKELVIKDAERYFTEEKAMSIYESVPDAVKEQFKFKGEARELFELIVETHENYDDVPKLSLLAEWVDKNNDDLFVKAKSEKKERTVKKLKNRGLATALARINTWMDYYDDDDNYKWVTEYYLSPVSIESLLTCSYNLITVQAKSKYPNINSTKLYILPFLSKTRLVILSCMAFYKPSGWDSEVLIDNNIKWTPHTIELITSNDIKKHLTVLAKNFENETLHPILKAFKLLPDSDKK